MITLFQYYSLLLSESIAAKLYFTPQKENTVGEAKKILSSPTQKARSGG